jgi:predicted PP-loop superfamily ATPase
MKRVERLRREAGAKSRTEPKVVDVRWEDGTLVIVGADRSDMSYFIGPGGYVAGRLREELGLERVVVQAWTDLRTRLYRLKLAREAVERALKRAPELERVLHGIRLERERLLGERRWDFWEEWEGLEPCGHRITVAVSGGYDSTASALILRKLGYEVEPLTVDPGPMILPRKMRENVELLARWLDAEPRFIESDFSDIVRRSLEEGRIHPCGRCNDRIRRLAVRHAGTDVVAFGDGLPTGSHCVQRDGDRLRLHVPAALAKTKFELRRLVEAELDGFHEYRYSCPLLHQVHERHPHLRRASIQRVLRELRHGFLEVGEALRSIMDILGGES